MKCLIADTMHESLMPMLEEIGVEPVYDPRISREEMRDRLPEFDGLIIRSKTTVDADLIGKARKLRFVARAGAGIDKLDTDELERRHIAVLNAPEGNRNAVAEHTLGMLLALLQHLMKGNREIREGIWDREGNRGFELAGRTVGIIGYGFMGQAFARKLRSMECRVLAYDKYKTDYEDDHCTAVTPDRIFSEAEIVSLHIPLTPENKGMVDDDFLSRFTHPIILLNTARGEILSQEALLNALKDGRVTAAGLDVLENEKLDTLTPDQREVFAQICAHPRILLTPHVAGWTFESYVRINEILCRKIALLLKEKA